MNPRRNYFIGSVLFIALFFVIANYGAKPVYATYGNVTVTKEDTSGKTLSGWTITLGHQKDDGSWEVFGTQTTDSNGQAAWTGVHYGTYIVCETNQSGWTMQPPTDSNGCQGPFTIGSGSVNNSFTFVNSPPLHKIKIIKKDIDHNPLSGWSFTATDTSDNSKTYNSSPTDSNGVTYISGLPIGTFTVCEISQPGWIALNPSSGCQNVIVDASTPTGETQTAGVTTQGGEGGDNCETIYFVNGEVGIVIKKYTNGFDADDANGSDVPKIAPGADVVWTYIVTNTGNVPLPLANVVVTDNVQGAATYVQQVNPIGDATSLDPGESWLYKIEGKAATLVSGQSHVVDGCVDAGKNTRPTYENYGYVSVKDTSLTSNDPSHYCGPDIPGIVIKKYTNGYDADNANGSDVPKIAPGADVAWTYIVTNTGNVPFLFANVVVTDNVKGAATYVQQVKAVGDATYLDPGESWLYRIEGKAATLVSGQNHVVNGCKDQQNNTRPTYENYGYVSVKNTSLTSNDPSHYCGPDVPGIVIKKYTNGFDADNPTGPLVAVGSTVTWTYVVTNSGNVPLSNVVVTDNIPGVVPKYVNGDTNNNKLLDLTEKWLYRTTGIAILGQYENVGYTKGTPPSGPPDVTSQDLSHYKSVDTALGDYVWLDSNKNGVQDDGATSGVGGVTVTLLQGNCSSPMNPPVSTKTNQEGFYLFDHLTIGASYCIQFGLPNGYAFTKPNQGSSDQDSDADQTTGKTPAVTLTSSTPNLTLDAGLIKNTPALASLGDYVWFDANHNGIQDTGETGVAGVKVTLFNGSNQQVGQPQATSGDGKYLFTDLLPGTYYVIFDKSTLPPGFVFTKANVTNNGATTANDSDANETTGKTAPVTLVAGQSYLDLDAGIFRPSNPPLAALGDYVWFDVNKNGLQDSNETGVSGVTVVLHKADSNMAAESALADSNIVATQVTNSAGKYLFTDLQPGTYYVEFKTVQGYSYTRHNVNGNSKDALDSDARVPWIDLVITGDGKEAQLGKDFVFTFHYTNTEDIGATNVVISNTVPPGTSLDGVTNPGWNCNGSAAGSGCTLTLGAIAPHASGSVTFTVHVNNKDSEVPDTIDFLISMTNGTAGVTDNVTLVANETNLTVDAGLVLLTQSLKVPRPTEPTNLPENGQPQHGQPKLFLPALQGNR